MATTSKTKKKTKATRKKTAKKKAQRKSTADTAAAAPEDKASATESATEEKSKRTRKRTSSKKKTQKSTKAATSAADRTETKPKRSRRRKSKGAKDAAPDADEPKRSATQIEEQDGAIIIRFPPVAPSPFAAQSSASDDEERAADDAPAAVATVETEAPEDVEIALDEPLVDEPVVEEDESDFVAPAVAPVAPDTGDDEDESGEQLSRSKKRRMRRRRRRRDKDDSPKSDEPAARFVPDEDDTAPAKEPAPVDAESVADVEDSDEETSRYLEAAASIKASLSEAEAAAASAEIEDIEDESSVTLADLPKEERGRRDKSRRRRRGRRFRQEVDLDEGPKPAPKEEATERVMIINAIPREECRIGILADNRLEEIYFERATSENHVGNIYKGIVTNVEPSIQAAFIDFGQGKNGFLHISDLHPQYFPDGQGQTENVGHKMPRRHRPPIQRCLKRGQKMIVQVTKEGIGTKGPTLSTYLSIPGRFLVMMPGMGRLGVSRRIEDDDSRDKLRKVLASLELPDGMGFIARTAAVERTKRELQGDLTYLTRLWRAVENRIKNDPAPAELYRESDLVIRTIRDVFTSDVQKIYVDDPEVANRAREFLSIFSPRSADIVTAYEDPQPIFHKYGIEAELDRLHSRRVPLKSGGSLVIEPTEALVAIDVNSGRFRTEDDAEATAYKINCEAADEIARQLRLRDLGGVVVCDFIDMRMDSHKREIERRLARHLRDHKERAKVLRMSDFGIIELTRQRQRASLTRSVYQDCRHCRGTGLVKTVESVALDVMRLVQLAVTRDNIFTIEVTVSPDVAFLLQNRKRRLIHELESKNRRIISIRPDPAFSLDQVEIRCTDPRGRLVPHNT